MSTSLPIKKGCKDAAVNNNAVVHQLLLDGVQIALVLVEGLKVGEHIILWVWPVPRRVAPVPLAGVCVMARRQRVHACMCTCMHTRIHIHTWKHRYMDTRADRWMDEGIEG